jgi:two-component system nitrate/nitrite response regulator NarL
VGGGTLDRPVAVAIVEDHDVVIEGVRAWLARDPERRATVIAVSNSIENLMAGPGRAADVVVLDLDLGEDSPGDLGVTRDKVTRRVSRLTDAGLRVVVFSVYVKPLIVQAAVSAGASTFLDKKTEQNQFVETVIAVANDLPYVTRSMAGGLLVNARLSPRENEALLLLFQGMNHASIARRMAKRDGKTISEATVKQYIERARAKFAAVGRPCRSNTSLLARCIEEGRITPEEVADYRSAAAGEA